jgi:hypothetical protein
MGNIAMVLVQHFDEFVIFVGEEVGFDVFVFDFWPVGAFGDVYGLDALGFAGFGAFVVRFGG